jgi:hypothetical protein
MILVTMNKEGLENRLRTSLLWAQLVFIGVLAVFSILGAFAGARRAQKVFNSIPLAIYWVLFAALLIAGFNIFKRLLDVPGLLLAHLGCLFVLVGGIWGSQAGIKTQNSLFGSRTIRAGQMVIYEGQTQNSVLTDQGTRKDLPFSVKLVDFRIQYYEPGVLLIQTMAGKVLPVKAEPGTKFSIDHDYGSVEILRRFESFKLKVEGGQRIVTDDPNGAPNPALELLLTRPDGSQVTRYAFERFGGRLNNNDRLGFSYQIMIRDFISDVEVIRDNKPVARKSIEVNKPLHFGGYLFYQQGYDDTAGRYTVLRVTSDKGLYVVYLGFVLLCAGMFWHLWAGRLFGKGLSGKY